MPIKKNLSQVLFAMLLITFFNFLGCRKKCINNHYDFHGTGLFYPEKDSIEVGDTIWCNSIIPMKNLDINSNQTIDYSGASNFATDINFNIINSNDPTIGAVDSFKYIPVNGDISTNLNSTHASKSVTYLEETDNYLLTFGIVALKKGIYVMTVVDIENSYKKCSKAYINFNLNNIDKHQYYLKEIYFSGSP